MAPVSGPCPVELGAQQQAVRQARERIMQGLVLEPILQDGQLLGGPLRRVQGLLEVLLHPLVGRDVGQGAVHAQRPTPFDVPARQGVQPVAEPVGLAAQPVRTQRPRCVQRQVQHGRGDRGGHLEQRMRRARHRTVAGEPHAREHQGRQGEVGARQQTQLGALDRRRGAGRAPQPQRRFQHARRPHEDQRQRSDTREAGIHPGEPGDEQDGGRRRETDRRRHPPPGREAEQPGAVLQHREPDPGEGQHGHHVQPRRVAGDVGGQANCGSRA